MYSAFKPFAKISVLEPRFFWFPEEYDHFVNVPGHVWYLAGHYSIVGKNAVTDLQTEGNLFL
jgi:hypothetical protein